jgi:heat shock protein HslJ
MCVPALMEQESTLLQALDRVSRFEISNGQLSLFDQQGTLQIKAKRTKN